MKILITGGGGFIGSFLIDTLLAKNYKVIVVGLTPPKQNVDFFKLDLVREKISKDILENVDAIINLAGKNIFGRWNERFKKEIYESRVLSTRTIIESIKEVDKKPKVFISASAVGYYGDRGEEELDEDSLPGKGFLAKVCVDWEKESLKAEDLGIRSVQIRKGIVLGNGGFIYQILPFYKLGLGGPLGKGNQWFSWVHINDVVNIYLLTLENNNLSGPIIACSPQSIKNKDFSKIVAKVLKKPAFIKIPKILLKIMFGEFADEILASQKVYPKKLIKFNYKFEFLDLEKALADILIK